MNVAGSTFLVTGGASGLGAATARSLVAGGGKAIIADTNESLGRSLCTDLGESAAYARTDVTDPESVAQAVAAAKAFGGLHGLINCAGLGRSEVVVHRDRPHGLVEFERVIAVNLVGMFNAIRLAASEMTSNAAGPDGERGVIVNTASVAAFDGQIGQAAYAASKGGVVSMTLPLAREFARFGIRVVTIAPGLFDTPLLATLPDDARQALESQVPFPARLGKPSEFAALVLHVVENTMLNGEVIRLDGAIRMNPR